MPNKGMNLHLICSQNCGNGCIVNDETQKRSNGKKTSQVLVAGHICSQKLPKYCSPQNKSPHSKFGQWQQIGCLFIISEIPVETRNAILNSVPFCGFIYVKITNLRLTLIMFWIFKINCVATGSTDSKRR